MDAFFILADQHAKTTLHDVGHSALPNAPVLPYVEPRHRMRRLVAAARSAASHGPHLAVPHRRRATDCGPL
ncbi:MAG: hypothetical protein JWN99_190 [Ilumatobacteraceae bacterium]|nr:hypothetical protein [Ilumatobacteraceae bacterium]